MLKILVPVLVLLLGLAAAARLIATGPRVETQPVASPAPLVRVVEATPQKLQLRVRTHGTIMPRTESDLVPEVSGPIVWVAPSFASGSFFEKGDPLLRIDPRDYEVALERARAHLARAQSEHRRAHKELERRRDLAAREAASAAQLDDAVNAERVTAASVRDTVAAAEQAERDLGRTEIRAPYRGRVREEGVDVGQFVNRGQAVAKLYAVDFAEVRLPIPDEELAYLDLPMLYRGENGDGAEGPQVLLSARFAGAQHTWRGRVVRTEGEIDPKSRMVHVVARIADPYLREGDRPPLSVGLFVEAEILGQEVTDVVVVPRRALRGKNTVWVVDAESRLRFRSVEVLRTARDQAVIGAGIDGADRVCISVLEAAVDGMRVRVAGDVETER